MMNLGLKIPSLRPTWDGLVKWGLFTCTSIIFCGLMLCVYWLLIDRSDPVTVQYGEVARFEHQANDSWVMIIRWHGTRHRQCWGNSQRWISGDFVLPLPDIPYPPDRPEQQLGHFTWEVPVEIPAYYVSTGHIDGHYAIRIEYACNPLQEYLFPIVVTPDPVKFTIPTDMPMKKVNFDSGRSEDFVPEGVGK